MLKEIKDISNMKKFVLLMLIQMMINILFINIYKKINLVNFNQFIKLAQILLNMYVSFYFVVELRYKEKIQFGRIAAYILIFSGIYFFISIISSFFVFILTYILGIGFLSNLILIVFSVIFVVIILYYFLRIKFYVYSKVNKDNYKKFREHMWNKNRREYRIFIILSVMIAVIYIFSALYLFSSTEILLLINILIMPIIIVYNYVLYAMNVDIYGSYLEFEEKIKL